MKLSSLLITTQEFLLGGTETFLIENVEVAKKKLQCRVGLLVEKVSDDKRLKIFDVTRRVRDQPSCTLRSWLQEGDLLVKDINPGVIWSHHYGLLASWLLSYVHQIPLHVTLHGSLRGLGKINSKCEALGLTLAIHRGGIVSAVSQEIVDEISSFGINDGAIYLFPNTVSINKKVFKGKNSTDKNKAIKIIMLTRKEKVQHQREAFRFLYEIRKKNRKAKLTIYSDGWRDSSSRALDLLRQIYYTAKILSPKWILNNIQVVGSVFHAHHCPSTDDPRSLIAQSDIVLGMGRVILEGIAENRVSVLIGYNEIIGMINQKNFRSFRYSNFSGRGVPSMHPSDIALDAINALDAPQNDDFFIEYIDTHAFWEKHLEILNSLIKIKISDFQDFRLTEMISTYMNSCFEENSFIDNIVKTLKREELETYRKLRSLV